jgi:hypothetical protein
VNDKDMRIREPLGISLKKVILKNTQPD